VLSFWFNPHFYATAERALLEQRPDVIQCETLWPAVAGWRLKAKYGVPLVCAEYNVEADKFAALGRPAPLVALVRHVERLACQKADHVVTLTDGDRARLVQGYGLAPERASTIQPSPDLEDSTFSAESRDRVRAQYGLAAEDALLTFVGNLEYEPNQQAVRRIAEVIYPAVLARHPNARFVVIGQGAERLRECRRERLTFTGYLSRQDLLAHLSASDVFLVPVETGAGMRVKIPEATACARAVVATHQACAGLEFFRDDELVRVEGVDEHFVEAVLRLIEDPALREDLGQRARARTELEFGWQRTLDAYEAVYERIVHAHQHQASHKGRKRGR
jgi:glycosyltransferase involved in cell wall biosynthesis